MNSKENRMNNDLTRLLEAVDNISSKKDTSRGVGRVNDKYKICSNLCNAFMGFSEKMDMQIQYLSSRDIGLFLAYCAGDNNLYMQFMACIDNKNSKIYIRYENEEPFEEIGKKFFHNPISDAFSHHSRELYGYRDVKFTSGFATYDEKTHETVTIESAMGFNRRAEQNGYAHSFLKYKSDKPTGQNLFSKCVNSEYRDEKEFVREIEVNTDYLETDKNMADFVEFHRDLISDPLSNIKVTELLQRETKVVVLPNSKEILEESKGILETLESQPLNLMKPIDIVSENLRTMVEQQNTFNEESSEEISQ